MIIDAIIARGVNVDLLQMMLMLMIVMTMMVMTIHGVNYEIFLCFQATRWCARDN